LTLLFKYLGNLDDLEKNKYFLSSAIFCWSGGG